MADEFDQMYNDWATRQKAAATQVMGEHDATQEQDGYQSQIDSRRLQSTDQQPAPTTIGQWISHHLGMDVGSFLHGAGDLASMSDVPALITGGLVHGAAGDAEQSLLNKAASALPSARTGEERIESAAFNALGMGGFLQPEVILPTMVGGASGQAATEAGAGPWASLLASIAGGGSAAGIESAVRRIVTSNASNAAAALERTVSTPISEAPARAPEVAPEVAKPVPEESLGEPAEVPQLAAAHPEVAPQAQPITADHPSLPELAAAPEKQVPGRFTVSLPAEKTSEVLQAINEGRFADAATSMLDSTHQNFPWESLSDAATLKNVFAAVEDGVGGIIKDAAGVGPVSQQAVVQMAKDIGGDVSSLTRLTEGVTGEGGLAARITAGYNMLLASARQLKTLAAQVNMLRPDTAEGAQALLDFEKQLTLHGAIVGQVRRSSEEIGRALWAHRALKGSADVALSNLSDYVATATGAKNLQKIAQTITDATDLASITNASDKVVGTGFSGVVREIGTNGMLSGPKTLLRNAVGLLVKGGYSLAERYVAAGIGGVQRLINPEAEAATFREAVAHTMGMGQGIKAAAKLAMESVKDEAFTGPFNQMAFAPAVARSTEGRTGADLALSQAINALGTVVRFPGRALGIMDHFSQAVGYYGDLNARAYVQAAKEADGKGLADAARDAFLTDRVADIVANPTAELKQKALDAGSFQAFLETPQTSVGQPLMNFFNSNPWLKFFVAPFTHRPGNLMRQATLDYSPLAFAKPSTWKAIAAGGSDSSMALARPIMGTGLALALGDLAMNGRLTGARLGPNNTQALDGIPPYSVKLGDSWYRYDGIDPIGIQLGMVANVHEYLARHWDPNSPDITSAAFNAMAATAESLSNTTFDKSFLKSVSLFFAAAGESDPEKRDQAWQKFVASNVGKMIPFSGALGAAAQAIDPDMKETRGGGIKAQIEARLPWLSQDLPPRRDLLGRPVPVQSWWSPFSGADENPDQMDRELSALSLHITPPAHTLSGVPDGPSAASYQLTPQEYDEVMRNATTTPIFNGRTLAQALRDATASDQWAANKTAQDGGVGTNGKITQEYLDAAYKYGREQFLRDNPGYIAAKQAAQVAKFRAMRPTASAQDIAAGRGSSFLNGVQNEPKQ